MIDPDDLSHCREVIRTGSLSFHAASKLLPRAVRDPALVLYAFCRLADDTVDEGHDKTRAVLCLAERLERIYAGEPRAAPEDRAFAAVAAAFDIPRALPDALLEGLAWDAEERRYDTLSDLTAYSARVASAVGAMMCLLMGVRDRQALARACDLGVAMQLTNIARDVGEDARAGRIYLPLGWLNEAGIGVEAFLADPRPVPEIRALVARLLSVARLLYLRSEAGVARLPCSARPGIYAARFVYAAIGDALRQQEFDSITRRAHTGRARKLLSLGREASYAAGSLVLPRPATIYAAALPEVRFLVEAAGTAPEWQPRGRAAVLLATLAELKAQDIRSRQGALLPRSVSLESRHEPRPFRNLPAGLLRGGRDRRGVQAR